MDRKPLILCGKFWTERTVYLEMKFPKDFSVYFIKWSSPNTWMVHNVFFVIKNISLQITALLKSQI